MVENKGGEMDELSVMQSMNFIFTYRSDSAPLTSWQGGMDPQLIGEVQEI